MTNSLTCCHINAQSLPAHFDEFLEYFTGNFFHLISVSESWLRPSIPSSSVSLPDYTLLRHDREDRIGGGVCLYVHSTLSARVLATSPPSSTPQVEFILVDITCNSCSILCVVVYRPPNVPFETSLESALYNFIPFFNHIIISGDFNSNFLSSSPDKLYLENLFSSLNLFIVPFDPTHHTRTSDTWLDLIVIDSNENLLSFSQHPVAFLSQHDLILITYNMNVPTFSPRTLSFRKLDSLTHETLQTDLDSIDWSPVFSSPSIDEKVEILTSSLLSILDIHAPIQTRTFRRPPAPWMDDEIRALRRGREAARRRARRTGHPDDRAAYVRLRNLAQTKLRSARIRYFHHAFSSNSDPKSKWNLLRKLSLCDSSLNPPTFPSSPDEFNTHFISASHSSGSSHNITLPSPSSFNPNSFFFGYITPEALVAAVLSIKTQSVGCDGIPINLLKACLPSILPILLHIYDFSLQNSVFPKSWKQATVKPLSKIPSPSSPNDFRPISILSILAKPLEKLVQSQISAFLENSHLLDPLQSGFRPNFSTQSALLKITSDIQSSIDHQQITILILLDFSKAFDTIDHSLLLTKLKSFSFSDSAIRWFHSYLSDRSQVVSIPDKPPSSALPISSGVPQGSCISSTLFCCYINDLPRSLSSCTHHLYADDFQIYLSFPPSELPSAIIKIQRDLDAVCSWASDNKLKLNVAKSQAIVFGSSPLLHSLPDIPPFTVNQHPISFCSTVKNLGVILDPTLTWKPHVSQISRRCFLSLRQFRRASHLLPPNIRKLLVSSLILPHFDYGCLVYGGLVGGLEDRIKRIMNCFVRFVFGSPRDSHVTNLYADLMWLYPNYRRQYILGTFLYRTISSHSPSYIYELLTFKSAILSRQTRSRSSDLYPPSHRTTAFSRSFLIRSSNLWNSLPSSIRHAPSLSTFKSRLYNHLFLSQTSTM